MTDKITSGQEKNNFTKIWKNKRKILEGLWYNHVVFYFNKLHWAKKLVDTRREICLSCKYLDKYGLGGNVVIKGRPACSLCGCNIMEKTACLSCDCSLKDEGREPLWKAVKIKDDYILENKLENASKIYKG